MIIPFNCNTSNEKLSIEHLETASISNNELLSSDLDNFLRLKSLVEELRSSVPWQNEAQCQRIGIYMLAAYRLGTGLPEELLFNTSPKLKLTVV